MSERECDRAAARIAPPATTAHHRTNGKPEKRDEQARPLQTNFYRETSLRGHPECAFRNERKGFCKSKDGKPTKDLAAQYVRANPCLSLAFVYSEQFICPGKAIVSVYRSHRHSARLRLAPFLGFAPLGKPRLRKTSRATHAQDDR